MIPQPLQNLIKHLSKLPGFGPRSAQRAALHLIQNTESMATLQRTLLEVANTVQTCTQCGNIGLTEQCHICTDVKRSSNQLCVVEGVDDLWAIERAGIFKGHYHVLGGVINAMAGIGPEDITLPKLVQRVEENPPEEIILALGASVDGQTTAHLISTRLAHIQGKGPENSITISQPARGLPIGAEVDYMDDGTLSIAFQGRRKFG